jgi:hypothetical protein
LLVAAHLQGGRQKEKKEVKNTQEKNTGQIQTKVNVPWLFLPSCIYFTLILFAAV